MVDIDILPIVEHYTSLTACGGGYKALCPSHEEKTPSFTVNTEENLCYCFGCGLGGDAIKFVRAMEGGCSFMEAVAKCEEILGEKIELEGRSVKDKIEKKKQVVNYMTPEEIKEFQKDKSYTGKGYRGIKDEYLSFYRHLTQYNTDGSVKARYYPETRDGRLTGYKCRNHPKDFTHGKVGVTGGKSDLSGQCMFKTGGKYILITGGCEDKVAAYQMFSELQKSKNKGASDSYSVIPVVSVTSGESNAAAQCALQYEFLDMFDNIVLGFDNDAAGERAARETAEVLPKHKIRIVKWTKKDPNEMLQLGLIKQFSSDFWNARDYVASGISSSVVALGGVEEFLLAPKIGLPPHLSKLEEAMRGGIKSTGCIGNIIADTSTGKTLITDTLLYHWVLNYDITPTIVSIERTKEEFICDMLSLHLKRNLVWFKEGQEAVDYLHREDVKELYKNLITNIEGRPNFYIIDERDGDLEVMQGRMELAAGRHNSLLFVIDPLTDLVRSLSLEEQEKHMMWQKYKKKQGWKILNVLHTRKPLPDKEGKIRPVTEYDALGSGTFVQSADWNWVLNRDKMAEDTIDRNTMQVDMPKCRGGDTGHIVDLYYDKATRQQYDKEEYFKEGSVTIDNSTGEVIESTTIKQEKRPF